MKKGTRFFISVLIVMAMVMNFTGSCTKDSGNTDPSNVSLTDKDGNTYKTVKIGSQIWMAENLKTTTFNDNTAIPDVADNSAWIILTTPGYCWYGNDEASNKPVYGALYNWYAVNTGKLCPAGWHVPSNAEFDTLKLFLGLPPEQVNSWGWGGTDQGTQLKSMSGWADGENGTNTSGFTALPGGYRYGADGTFNAIGKLSYWWSSTEDGSSTSWYLRLDGSKADIYNASTAMTAGKYVRCVKD